MPPRCSGQVCEAAILIAGDALYGKGLIVAGCIATATGSKLLTPYPSPVYNAAQDFRAWIVSSTFSSRQSSSSRNPLVDSGRGAEPPVAYFAYPGKEQCIHFARLCDLHTGEAGRRLCRCARWTRRGPVDRS